jgi:hypothetical protein
MDGTGGAVMTLSRLKAFLQSVPDRLYGSYISQGESFMGLSSKAQFPADQALERRIRAAREALGTVEPKPVRKTEPKPPLDYEELPNG